MMYLRHGALSCKENGVPASMFVWQGWMPEQSNCYAGQGMQEVWHVVAIVCLVAYHVIR